MKEKFKISDIHEVANEHLEDVIIYGETTLSLEQYFEGWEFTPEELREFEGMEVLTKEFENGDLGYIEIVDGMVYAVLEHH